MIPEETCTRCEVGTESYVSVETLNNKYILCSDCCRNFIQMLFSVPERRDTKETFVLFATKQIIS